MNPFEKLMRDIYANKNFIEYCTINGKIYECICSSIPDGVVYTDFGQEGVADFTLDFKLPMSISLSKNMKVTFRNKQYKISDFETDSANTSIKVHLIATSKGF